jgi:hypothetical protein
MSPNTPHSGSLKPHIQSDGSTREMSCVTSKFYRRQHIENAPEHETKGLELSVCILLHGAIRISLGYPKYETCLHTIAEYPVQ